MDNTTRQAFFEEYYPVVTALASSVARETHIALIDTVIEVDDLVSVGLEMLTRAAPGFDPTNPGARSYLYLRIRGAMIDFLRTHGRYRTKKVSYTPPLSLDYILNEPEERSVAGDDAPSMLADQISTATLEEQVLARERFELARQAIQDVLNPREQRFLAWYLEGMQKKEIARRLHLSPIRISQIHGEIITKIKAHLEE